MLVKNYERVALKWNFRLFSTERLAILFWLFPSQNVVWPHNKFLNLRLFDGRLYVFAMPSNLSVVTIGSLNYIRDKKATLIFFAQNSMFYMSVMPNNVCFIHTKNVTTQWFTFQLTKRRSDWKSAPSFLRVPNKGFRCLVIPLLYQLSS